MEVFKEISNQNPSATIIFACLLPSAILILGHGIPGPPIVLSHGASPTPGGT